MICLVDSPRAQEYRAPMQTQTGFRFRCYPAEQQAQILLRWIGCQRFIYNAKAAEDRYYRTFARKALGVPEPYPSVDQQYRRYIDADLTPWLQDVPAQVLRNGAVRWRQAYARFFRGLGARPTIKKKIGRQAIWLASELFSCDPVADVGTGEI